MFSMFSMEFGTDEFWNLMCAMGVAGIIFLFCLLFWFRYQDRRTLREAIKGNALRQLEEHDGETREVYVSGYAIKVKYHDGIWYSPFVNASGQNFNSSNIESLRHSIRTCLKKPDRFQEQFNRLEDAKIITKLSDRKVIDITGASYNEQAERRAS
ncbi:hypothetical protein HGA34_01605 [Candidatus Falkowbacteria bacterium]|nr:hypothetical protein [Candidatus Falkowbacteria bacterium]